MLAYLRENRGFDFTGYKRMSLQRRVRKRSRQVGLTDFAEYMDYLQVHPEEFTFLFNTILINVTGFFRDQPAWDYLAREVVPSIIAAKAPGEPIRVWSAGCASGEEPLSIAMVLAEALQPEAFNRVKIYATDVDADALAFARRSAYSAKDLDA